MSNPRARSKPVKGPQLGDTTFEEWFATPVFDTDPDERLEHLATSRRASARLVGSVALSLLSLRRHLPRPGATAGDDQAVPDVVDLRDGLRQRVDGFLDRWAELEVAGGAKLEDIVLPKRWRA